MHRAGHYLDFRPFSDELTGVCECGQWQITLPVPSGADVLTLIAHIMREHENHLHELDESAQDQP